MLNPADLDAITQEARLCFLEEDVPEYLTMLEQGLHHLHAGQLTNLTPVYTNLMRAAHSLKGGAGIAQLPTLSQVAHKLEDLLEALKEGEVTDQATAHELLSLGVEQIHDLVAAAAAGRGEGPVMDLPICAALDEFLQILAPVPTAVVPATTDPEVSSHLIKATLETDLESCLQRVEQALQGGTTDLKPVLAGLVEECTLLGQVLGLNWLVAVAEQITQALDLPDVPLPDLAIAALEEIRQQRDRTLATPTPPEPEPEAEPTPMVLETAAPVMPEPVVAAPITPEIVSQPVTQPVAQPAAPLFEAPDLNLRIPVARLDRMANTVGELLINHERLSLYQHQLQQVSLLLKQRAQQFDPIKDQVQTVYDRLATPLASLLATRSEAETTVPATDRPTTPASEFDTLEFDRYTELHTTLQDFQELLTRIQESREDVDLLSRDLQEALDQLRQHLNHLRTDLTDARLVPFQLLASRFTPALETLNQRHHKSAVLEIQGGETLVDQAILEQLKTPLTHLFRNAFDHGIEPPAERQASGKPPTARITLSAKLQGNQVVVAIADDGQGINLEKVVQQVIAQRLYSPEQLLNLTQDQILEFLFMAGFSTAAAVTSLSGRGVGLDVVRQQVERLRGRVRVETVPGQGTTFTISIPLTLSILPLLLFQCQRLVLAVPSVNVREVVNLAEVAAGNGTTDQIHWQEQTVPLYSLLQLLPYRRPGVVKLKPEPAQKLALVVDMNGEPLAVAIDTLLGERELVLKPFDPTIPVPAYVMGCTVLGTGQVVPILSPNHFDDLVGAITPKVVVPPVATPTLPPDDQAPAILIVDDSVAVRRLLGQVLAQAGYQVVACRDGQEALEELQRDEGNFSLVISDVEMPRLDGYALLREIRTHARWHRLPVAMLTSRASETHRQKAMSLGATTYFVKPFQPAELLTAVAALLD